MRWPWQWRSKLRVPEPDKPSEALKRMAAEHECQVKRLVEQHDYFSEAVDDALRRAR